jgi:hypothetical protein
LCPPSEEIAKNFKSALVVGTSAKHSRGQKVGLDRESWPASFKSERSAE